MTTSAAAIIPITITVNARTGLTLWAPPWEDEDGDEWHGFLGDGKKILLYPNTADLAAFIASGEENDLSDHPYWGQVLKSTPDQLRPAREDQYDLDEVYDLAAGEPDPVHVSSLANTIDMVGKIADCCDDGALRRLIEGTPEYADLLDEEVSYQGRDGRKAWNDLGDTIAESWERAIKRVEDWLEWVGDFTESEFGGDESIWERVGAEPIALRFSDETLMTVRAEVTVDAEGDDTEVVFLGTDGENVAVFGEVEALARYCREAEEHPLHKLEWWEELADVEDDADFAPTEESTYDLRKPTAAGADLVRELAVFCGLEADTDVLDGTDIDRDDWNDLVTELRTTFVRQD